MNQTADHGGTIRNRIDGGRRRLRRSRLAPVLGLAIAGMIAGSTAVSLAGGASAAVVPTPTPTFATPSNCPVPTTPPPVVKTTISSISVTYQGVNLPQCNYPAGTPTFSVWKAGTPTTAPPTATVSGTANQSSGTLTVPALANTTYTWQLTSTGPGIGRASGQVTTPPEIPPFTSPPFTSTNCPLPTTRPATATTTATTIVVTYYGVDIPQCNYPAGTPTLSVWAGTAPSTDPPLAHVTGSGANGTLTVTGLTSGSYFWQLTSTGPGIPRSSGVVILRPSPPSSTITTTSPPPVSACSATSQVLNHWNGGYQAMVTVSATRPIAGWTVTWTSGQTFGYGWSANITASGAARSATNMSWNGALEPGRTALFGLIEYGAGYPDPAPVVACVSR